MLGQLARKAVVQAVDGATTVSLLVHRDNVMRGVEQAEAVTSHARSEVVACEGDRVCLRAKRREVRSIGKLGEADELPRVLAFRKGVARKPVKLCDDLVREHRPYAGPFFETESYVPVDGLWYVLVVVSGCEGEPRGAGALAVSGAQRAPAEGTAHADMAFEALVHAS